MRVGGAKLRGVSVRRLPLITSAPRSAAAGAAPLELPAFSFPPLALTGRLLAVADPQSDDEAIAWASSLVKQLVERGAAPSVLFASFGTRSGSGELHAQFSDAASFQPLEIDPALPPVAPQPLRSRPGALWVLVGAPWLLAFRAPLSVLLRSALPVLRWSEPMRALRGQVALELADEGRTLIAPLAQLLAHQ